MTSETKYSVKKALALYGCFVFLPLIIAISIYFLFRLKLPILMGNLWHPQPRNLSSGFDWLVFNLPDGLWAFGFMSFLIIICRNDTKLIRIVYYGIGFLLMMGHEAVQGTLLPGTFDPLDLLAIIIGIFSSWFLLS